MNTTKWSLWSCALLLSLAVTNAQAQSGYPSKPIRIITPTAPGSPPDLVARLLGEQLTTAWGQPTVVENRPGASHTIGLLAVAKAAPDGYTLGIFSTPAAVAPSLVRVPYDTATDFAPVSQIAWGSHILVVRAGSTLKSIAALISFAKLNPGQLTFASGGNGTPAHLAGEFFRLRTSIDIRHVPFKSSPAGVAALLGEQVDLMFSSTAAAAPQIRSRKLRALATTDAQRLPAFPDLPTMAELGYRDFDVRDWFGLVAPAETPREIIAKLAGEIVKVASSPEMAERFDSIGMAAATGSGPEKFAALIRSEIAKWAKVVREAGVRAD
jgi:tripartite-type tricarboxylate transporter receptor subunit TctC